MRLWIRCLIAVAVLSARRSEGAPNPPPEALSRRPPASQVISEAIRPPCASCIVLTVVPSQIDGLPAALNGLQMLVEASEDAASLRVHLAAIAARGGRPGVLWRGMPAEEDVPALAGAATVVLDLRDSTLPFDRSLFLLRQSLTSLRAAARGPLTLGVEPPPALAAKLRAEPVAGYWDFMIAAGQPGDAQVWRRADDLSDAGVALRVTRGAPGRWLMRVPHDTNAAGQALADLASASRWLSAGLLPLADDLRIRCGDTVAETFRDSESLDRIAFVDDCSGSATVAIQPAAPFERVQLSSGQTIVRVAEQAGDRFSTGAAVVAAARPTVAEIVARHQAAAARQAAAVRTVISTGTLTVTFEAPGFPAPVTVSSETTVYRDRAQTDLEQRDIRVNGIALRERTLRLPIIEPERVSAPPLVITLGDRYRYRLAGEERAGGVLAYVVTFEPRSSGDRLFRGRAWISVADYQMVRVESAQTGLRGAVVSSEQIDEFSRTADGEWLLARSDIRQLYQGAAYRTPIHRVLTLQAHDVNAVDFDARRATAYASDHTILRDTPAGYRYLDKAARHASSNIAAIASPADAAAPGDRPHPARRVRTLAFGTIVDPNISRPLPFAGVSYLDFDLFGTGAQVNAFFGGSYGQLAFSVPSVHGTRWQLAGQAFGIAASYNDRQFVGGREQYDRNLRQRPAFGAVWLLRPITPRLAVRVGYELDYTHLTRSDATAAEFVAPASQVAHGLRLALEGQRNGWDGTIWWTGSRRAGWRAWGRPASGEYRARDSDFQRYGGSVARSTMLKPGLVARSEFSAMGGHDLDRFSRFAFGTFDNRLRGYPSALIRYDRGAALRTALAWSATRLFRVDGFADIAVVRDTGFSSRASRFTGVGAALEAPAPFGTLAAVEWGYGIDGIDAGGRRGTHVVRITAFKMF